MDSKAREMEMAAAQRRDVAGAMRRAVEQDGAVMLCADCGKPLDGWRSCYCPECEAAIYADAE